jgi:hypothetical protein
MMNWKPEKLRIVLDRLEGIDGDLAAVEADLGSAPPPSRLSAEQKPRIQARHRALKDKLRKAERESYVVSMEGPTELEAFWFPTVAALLHQDLTERVDSVDRDQLIKNVAKARATVGAAMTQVKQGLPAGRK